MCPCARARVYVCERDHTSHIKNKNSFPEVLVIENLRASENYRVSVSHIDISSRYVCIRISYSKISAIRIYRRAFICKGNQPSIFGF